jgi:hypothetical protein
MTYLIITCWCALIIVLAGLANVVMRLVGSRWVYVRE